MKLPTSSGLFGCLALAALTSAGLRAQTTPAAAPAAPAANDETVALDAYVVTGSMTPRKVIDSPIAITTMDQQQIQDIAPRSITEMMKVMPGIFTESSGGEILENVLVRGIALEGAFTYVVLQEDGLPVTSESTMRYATADQFTRLSDMIDHVDSLRGGSGNIFATNASQALINFISRDGSQEVHGEEAFTTSSFGTLKNEAWLSGPINKDTTYAIGAWYRIDNGERSPGYPYGNRGGQLMGNVKYTFENGRGYVKFSGKFLDDHNIFDVPFPLQNASNPQSIPFGPNIRTGSTADSEDDRRIFIPNTPLGPIDYDASNGVHSRVFYAGWDLDYGITDTLRVKDLFRYTSIDRSIDYYLNGTATPWQTLVNGDAAKDKTLFAAALMANGNYNFQLSYPGQGGAVFAPNPAAAAAAGNGYGLVKTFDHAGGPISDVQEDIRLTQSLMTSAHLSGGVYVSYLRNNLAKQFDQVLTDVTNGYHRVDISFLNAASNAPIGNGTLNGLYQGGSTFTNDTSDELEVSPYVEVEDKIGPVTFDAGLRHQRVREDATIELTQNVNANPAGSAVAALENFQVGNGNYVSDPLNFTQNVWTVGANYTIDPHLAVFGRYSDDARFISLTDLTEDYHSGRVGAAGNPTNIIKQGEVGVKMAGSKWSVFLTAFDIDLRNIFMNTVFTNPITNVQSTVASFQSNVSKGVELDSHWAPLNGLTLGLSGVWADSRLTDNNIEKQTLLDGSTVLINDNGLWPQRTPNVYGTFTASYRLPSWSFGALQVHGALQYTGKQYSDLANSEPDPLKPWTEAEFGLTFTLRNGISLRADVNNAFNSDAITEGDPRTGNAIVDPSAKSYNARPVYPRTFEATVSYNF